MADLTEELVAQIRDAAQAHSTLEIVGAGTKHWYGNPVAADRTLAVRDHAGIVEYDPAELVLTARSGTPLTELEAVLAERGQMLAFEPPRHAPGATLGGAMATALSGPARAYAGGARDFVLGLHLLDGHANQLKFGGQVMKNVAGYDVARLMTGALGILGVITQVSLKVLPLAPAQATLRFELSEADAMLRVNQWSGQALPLSASAWIDGVLTLRLAGARAAVDAATRSLGGVVQNPDAAAAFWLDLRDQTHPFFADPAQRAANRTLWRLSLPAIAPAVSAAQIAGAERQLIEWGGGQRWLWSGADAKQVRQVAQDLGGHAVRFDHRHGGGEAFAPPSAALMAVHQRLKQTFDPCGIFNPGRLYPGL